MKNIVVFTGAGVSAESGINTFRDSGGLWEKHRVEDVATLNAWHSNTDTVLDFYNQRRKQVLEAIPNAAHYAITSLQERHKVWVITQNIDDLHERAGTHNVLHLHGEIRKARSTADDSLIYPIDGWELRKGDKCEKGSQLRPHIVWFGELVPAMEEAVQLVQQADIFIIVGTSLEVYPAASLVNFAPPAADKYYVDPNAKATGTINIINEKACSGVPVLVKKILKDE